MAFLCAECGNTAFGPTPEKTPRRVPSSQNYGNRKPITPSSLKFVTFSINQRVCLEVTVFRKINLNNQPQAIPGYSQRSEGLIKILFCAKTKLWAGLSFPSLPFVAAAGQRARTFDDYKAILFRTPNYPVVVTTAADQNLNTFLRENRMKYRSRERFCAFSPFFAMGEAGQRALGAGIDESHWGKLSSARSNMSGIWWSVESSRCRYSGQYRQKLGQSYGGGRKRGNRGPVFS